MKTPLQYQITEYDCGPTSLLNGIRYLFEREEIPPDVPKYIMLYCLDAYNSDGESGKEGTSKLAMMFLSGWLNQFQKLGKLNVYSTYLSGARASLTPHSEIVGALQQGAAVVVRLMYGVEHYVLLTGAEKNNILMFDPYLRRRPFKEQGVELIADRRGRFNRRVAMPILNSETKEMYAMGVLDAREAVILYNTKTRKTPESTIEYFL